VRSDIGEVIKEIVHDEEHFPDYQMPKKPAARTSASAERAAAHDQLTAQLAIQNAYKAPGVKLDGPNYELLGYGGVCCFCSPHGNDEVIYPTAMTRFATLIIAASFCSNAAAPLVRFESPPE
jgi:hypothetical protein